MDYGEKDAEVEGDGEDGGGRGRICFLSCNLRLCLWSPSLTPAVFNRSRKYHHENKHLQMKVLKKKKRAEKPQLSYFTGFGGCSRLKVMMLQFPLFFAHVFCSYLHHQTDTGLLWQRRKLKSSGGPQIYIKCVCQIRLSYEVVEDFVTAPAVFKSVQMREKNYNKHLFIVRAPVTFHPMLLSRRLLWSFNSAAASEQSTESWNQKLYRAICVWRCFTQVVISAHKPLHSQLAALLLSGVRPNVIGYINVH